MNNEKCEEGEFGKGEANASRSKWSFARKEGLISMNQAGVDHYIYNLVQKEEQA